MKDFLLDAVMFLQTATSFGVDEDDAREGMVQMQMTSRRQIMTMVVFFVLPKFC